MPSWSLCVIHIYDQKFKYFVYIKCMIQTLYFLTLYAKKLSKERDLKCIIVYSTNEWVLSQKYILLEMIVKCMDLLTWTLVIMHFNISFTSLYQVLTSFRWNLSAIQIMFHKIWNKSSSKLFFLFSWAVWWLKSLKLWQIWILIRFGNWKVNLFNSQMKIQYQILIYKQ
jgi:hypothetical protein